MREQQAAARALEGERLSEEFTRPIEERMGQPMEASPIFRGTEAAPQREMLFRPPKSDYQTRTPRRAPAAEPGKPRLLPRDAQVFDRYGDRLIPGKYATDPLGKRVKVQGFVETPEGAIRAIVERGKQREEIAAENLTVRPAARERRTAAPAGRHFGESEMAYAERLLTESGRPPGEGELYANPVFDPRFWEKADQAVSESFTKPLARKLENIVGKVAQKVDQVLGTNFDRWLRIEVASLADNGFPREPVFLAFLTYAAGG